MENILVTSVQITIAVNRLVMPNRVSINSNRLDPMYYVLNPQSVIACNRLNNAKWKTRVTRFVSNVQEYGPVIV